LIALSNKCTCTMFLKKHIANASVISFLLHIQEFFSGISSNACSNC